MTTRTLALASALAALVLLPGCADEKQTFAMVFDPCEPLVLETDGATAEQLEDIQRAIDSWRQVASVQVALSGPADAPRLRVQWVESEWFMGHFDDLVGAIELATRVTDRDILTVVLAHELGHAFGLYHVDGRDSVMNKGNKTVAPTAGDANELETLWGTCIRSDAPLTPTELALP